MGASLNEGQTLKPSVRGSRPVTSVALAVCLGLGACAVRQAAPTVSGDGDYRGTATRFQASRRNCPRPGLLLHMSVRNGVMFYHWDQQDIQVTVLDNGTLSGSLPGVRLTGTHDGTIMQGDVTDGQCGLHFTLKKIGG
jgi:hypothetical protein